MSREDRAVSAIEPFEVSVPEAELEDLRARLAATRWPRPQPVGDWSQGVPLAYLRELCEYWGTAYDGRRLERRLNALPQFRTEIDGVGIHFIHVRSPRADALPLVLAGVPQAQRKANSSKWIARGDAPCRRNPRSRATTIGCGPQR